MDAALLHILVVFFVATLVRSAFGFGEALVAVPLLALRIPITLAVPLAVLLSVTVAIVIVLQDHEHIHFKSATWLVAATLPGLPIGLYLLTTANEHVVKSVMAILIMMFSAYSLLTKNPPHLRTDRRVWLCLAGFLAGVFGGAYGMNGPPLVIYGSLRRWSPQHFRATLQAYFLPASLLSLVGYASIHLLTPTLWRDFLLCLPGALIAIPLGRAINRRLHSNAFLRYVHVGLILISLMLLVRTLRN